MDEQYYLSKYAILSGRALRDYKDLECLKGAEPSATEEILDAEIAEKIQAYNEGQLRSFLSSDIEELNTCFSHGAYKAAIILARRSSSTGSPKSITSTTSRKTFWSRIGRAAG